MPSDTQTDRCLYCRGHSLRAGKLEHFLPERFGTGHPFVLPRGSVCDACNAYASRDLDPCLWEADPGNMLALWCARVPGKRGKRGKLRGHGLVLDPATGVGRFGDASVKPTNRARSEWFLARALHKVGLGLLAWRRGPRYAADHRFDDVARYVRTARPSEFRPYVRALGRWITDEVQIAFEMSIGDDPIVVGLQLATVTYWLALTAGPVDLGSIAGAVPFGRLVQAAPDLVHEAPWSTLVFVAPGWYADVHQGKLTEHGALDPVILTQTPIQRLRMDLPLWDASLHPAAPT